MKMTKTLLWVAMLILVAVACKDKDAEKKIAALEARVSQLEGKKGTIPTSTNPAVQTPQAVVEGPITSVKFETTDHDFGTIDEGDIVEWTYVVKNVGDEELIIQNAQPSCGCTVPEWTKEPIPAGGQGFIKARFDTKGKTNIQNKTITVTANTDPPTTTLRFKAMVTPAAK
jgi:hypothetical protein